MKLENRIKSFVKLGDFLEQFVAQKKNDEVEDINIIHYEKISSQIETEYTLNGWFSQENIRSSIEGVLLFLKENELRKWLGLYNVMDEGNPKKVGLILAGNIPLVGFHDLLCVLTSGNKCIIKLSSKDNRLFNSIIDVLISINEEFKDYIEITENRLSGFDAVIATGSNNSSRYFEYYFSKVPHIIRKNRNSVAILNGNETKDDLQLLSDDILKYYGLGCRNVSKLYVPKNYDFTPLFESMDDHKYLLNHNKYMNNHDYNSSIYLVNLLPHLDNGFLIIKPAEELSSPIAVVYSHEYENREDIEKEIESNKDALQCIVSADHGFSFETLPFGKAQAPGLLDYADNIDTMKFLTEL